MLEDRSRTIGIRFGIGNSRFEGLLRRMEKSRNSGPYVFFPNLPGFLRLLDDIRQLQSHTFLSFIAILFSFLRRDIFLEYRILGFDQHVNNQT